MIREVEVVREIEKIVEVPTDRERIVEVEKARRPRRRGPCDQRGREGH